ncbi:plasmid replication initiation protein [Shigella flexneri]|nr:plasmid replication initiation protein [Shigella flexneri]EFZ7823507.1 plasmid replication initiation protein [Shigella flexneri]MLJ87809.1 plasmid replication initiation protein [Shigella flexneri]
MLHVAGEKRQHRRVSRICDTGDIPLPRSLTRYARSFGCGERYRLTDGDGNFLEDTRKILSKEEIRPRRSRFSIGSAPLTSIAKSDAQISGGETRQDYKDPRRFPLVAPSCALLFLPFGLPVSFRCYGRGFSFHA